MKRLIAVLFVVALAFTIVSCASFGVWKPEVLTKLDAFGKWADEWVVGVVKDASVALAFMPQNNPKVQVAEAAVKGVTDALGAYHAVVAAGSGDPSTAQAGLMNAIQAVNQTYGDVKATVAMVGPAPLVQ
jgi:hypothetical protein